MKRVSFIYVLLTYANANDKCAFGLGLKNRDIFLSNMITDEYIFLMVNIMLFVQSNSGEKIKY